MLMVFVYNKLKNVTVNNKSVWLRLLYEGLYISMTCLSKCSEVGCYYCENLVQNNTKWKLKMWNVYLLLLIFEWKCIRISEISRKNLEIFWSSKYEHKDSKTNQKIQPLFSSISHAQLHAFPCSFLKDRKEVKKLS